MVSLDRFAYGLPDPQEAEPKIIDKCACGCGEDIEEGGEYLYSDDQWFYDLECLMKYHGAQWRVA